MRKSKVFLAACFAIFLLSGREKGNDKKQIIIKNTMNMACSFETVSVDIAPLQLADLNGDLVISEAQTKSEIVSQQIDTDGDGQPDAILFQPKVAVNSEKTYEVSIINRTETRDSVPAYYSRFVPERTNDYTWENNRVAFRTYGSVTQKMVEDAENGGTLSSGVDVWLKRVEYTIINNGIEKIRKPMVAIIMTIGGAWIIFM